MTTDKVRSASHSHVRLSENSRLAACRGFYRRGTERLRKLICASLIRERVVDSLVLAGE